MTESLCKYRTRNANLLGKHSERPGTRRVAVHQGKRFAYFRVAHPGQPSRELCWKTSDVGAQGLHKQNFRQFGEHNFSAWTRRAEFVHRESNRIFELPARRLVANADFENRRQTAEEGLTEFRIASHVTADKFCDLAAAAHAPRRQT